LLAKPQVCSVTNGQKRHFPIRIVMHTKTQINTSVCV